MNSDTGEIRRFPMDTPAEHLRKLGFDIALTDKQAAMLQPMPDWERIQWAKAHLAETAGESRKPMAGTRSPRGAVPGKFKSRR